jgi:predicted enzyme related to lactoylglutathione lyase
MPGLVFAKPGSVKRPDTFSFENSEPQPFLILSGMTNIDKHKAGVHFAASYDAQRPRGDTNPAALGHLICLQSADKAAERVGKLAGQSLCPAFDIFEAGGMATVQDPSGSGFWVVGTDKEM